MFETIKIGTEAHEDINTLAYSSPTYSAAPKMSTMFLDPSLGMPLRTGSSWTVKKEPKFSIHELCPEWGYTNDSTKVNSSISQIFNCNDIFLGDVTMLCILSFCCSTHDY